MKGSEVSYKTKSNPASLPLKGLVTKQTSVKWAIDVSVDGQSAFWIKSPATLTLPEQGLCRTAFQELIAQIPQKLK